MDILIRLKIDKIIGKSITKELVEKEPQITKSVNKLMKIICNNLVKYFKEHKIKSTANFEIDNG